MTARDFRALALELPEAIESAHMGVRVELKPARRPAVRRALHEAWRLRAPKRLLEGGDR